ncbi:zinc ribbon domain-containing protein [Neobacillus mesonae]|uniref:zinc ribbon domain-containing protein n=1 Tax=Neobacillus mesonae TaxID=1193713 RepID=UPI002040506A|nr:zinc ribbon domain-containing protein [Neobacillus mesonae]MCM3568997.1 zinc ribbon domain-containing protein [Neobacillus mesonae]
MSDLQTKLGGGLNKIQDSFQQGKQKLQTVQEMSQFKKEIQDISESRSSLILRLGEEAYRKIRTGELQDSKLREFTADIAKLDSQIYQAQKALDSLNQKGATKTCSNCGGTIDREDKFCGFCGQKQETPASSNDQTELISCPACEEQIPANGSFCPCCGSRLAL